MKIASDILALLGLFLGIAGAMLLSLRGAMDSKVSYARLLIGLLFRKDPYGGQPILESEGNPLSLGPDAKATLGWRCLVWGFLLQAIAVIVGMMH